MDDNNKEKKFEVEHSYVDFQYLIMGEKIRRYKEMIKTGKTHFEPYTFNDYELAKLMRTPDNMT